jgi:hypothetical protein
MDLELTIVNAREEMKTLLDLRFLHGDMGYETSLVIAYRNFTGMYCLHFQNSSIRQDTMRALLAA